ncbi:hypothetical protein H7J07_05210 [Mycobacterium koreense]|uniref:Uncharacterized protein n=1 Tax=Mycolicibacillus koreensis TaxID=1069220 RepID=A0A7I7SAT3_9MYCO|nr:hypothetical protein [Mycolicibacillus koreensis]MCV7247623.1 hypothetical protein [Mycolicibacillus koreensis]OSC32801.1 hypothetical protein B8W67_13690 [Mycolicibacillus koreensis]BBY54002.1 hypothetical protein MKOR_12530 [Mycolicibacillus koreensis]
MRFRETISHGDFRNERVASADDLDGFRRELTHSPYPMAMDLSEGNAYVQAAWDGLSTSGRGYLGWATFERIDD